MADDYFLSELVDGYWRIDGVGEINEPAEAMIWFHCSEIHKDKVTDPYNRRSTTGKHRSFTRSVRALIALTVGSIWHEGKKIFSPRSIPNTFTINAGRARIVSLDETLELNGQNVKSILPDSYFDMGENRQALANSAKYVIVPVTGNFKTQWLIVPCCELLRFYYGASERLITNTVDGIFNKYAHWEKCERTFSSPKFFSKIRLSKLETAILARANISDYAMAEMLWTHKRLSKQQLDNKQSNQIRPLALEAMFPFQDTTTLQIRGKRILLSQGINGDSPEWAVFAMGITSCNHSLGFRDLIVEHDDSESETEYQREADNGGGPPLGVPDTTSDPLPDTPIRPNSDLPEMLLIADELRFVDLQFVRLTHNYNDEKLKKQKPSTYGVEVNAASFGEGTSAKDSKDVLGISVHSHIVTPQRDIARFLDMLVPLRTLLVFGKPSIETIGLNNVIPTGSEYISTFPPMGGHRQWHKIRTPVDRNQRQLAIAKIQRFETLNCYLLEMELSPDEERGQCTALVHHKEFTEISEIDFNRLLRLTAIQKRWIKAGNSWEHQQDSDDANDWLSVNVLHRIDHLNYSREESPGEFSLLWAEHIHQKIRECT